MLRLQKELPSITNVMLTTALNWYKMNFRKQGFDDNGVQSWKPRKRERYRTRSGKAVDDTNRAILTKSAELKNSLRKRKTGLTRGVIESDKEYANIHNEGLMGKAWGKHSFKMPQRKFVGYSERLHKNLTFVITGKINRIFS